MVTSHFAATPQSDVVCICARDFRRRGDAFGTTENACFRAFINLRSQFHLHHCSQRTLTEIVSKITPNLGLILLANTKNNKHQRRQILRQDQPPSNPPTPTPNPQKSQTTVKSPSETRKVKKKKKKKIVKPSCQKWIGPNQNTDCTNEKLDLET